MDESIDKIQENKEYTTTTQDLKDINRRQQQYKALVNFFKTDMKIKTKLINLAPNPMDEYNEESRIDYLNKLFSELRDMEFKFKLILKDFNMESQLQDAFNSYFDKSKNEFIELGYGKKNVSLEEVYRKIFADLKPDLVE